MRQANFVDNPASDEKGAGASKKFTGHRMAKKAMMAEAGVIESQPGIIESTNIAPLNKMTHGLSLLPPILY